MPKNKYLFPIIWVTTEIAASFLVMSIIGRAMAHLLMGLISDKKE